MLQDIWNTLYWNYDAELIADYDWWWLYSIELSLSLHGLINQVKFSADERIADMADLSLFVMVNYLERHLGQLCIGCWTVMLGNILSLGSSE